MENTETLHMPSADLNPGRQTPAEQKPAKRPASTMSLKGHSIVAIIAIVMGSAIAMAFMDKDVKIRLTSDGVDLNVTQKPIEVTQEKFSDHPLQMPPLVSVEFNKSAKIDRHWVTLCANEEIKIDSKYLIYLISETTGDLNGPYLAKGQPCAAGTSKLTATINQDEYANVVANRPVFVDFVDGPLRDAAVGLIEFALLNTQANCKTRIES